MPNQPDDLKALGARIAEVGRKHAPKSESGKPPTTQLGIALLFGSELVGGLIVGFGLGWCVDWAFDHWSPWHTRPWGIVILVVLGLVAGIRNVMTDAKDINAELAKKDLEK